MVSWAEVFTSPAYAGAALLFSSFFGVLSVRNVRASVRFKMPWWAQGLAGLGLLANATSAVFQLHRLLCRP